MNYQTSERTLPEGISFNSQNELPQKIYFVLGEAQYSGHMSIYGYPIKTTPFLDSLYLSSNPHLTVYHDVFSPACLTRDAVRLLLSFDTPIYSSAFMKHKNILEMANDAGYQTFWLTNNNTIHGGVFDSYASLIARSADFYHYVGDDYYQYAGDDFQLLSIVKEQSLPDTKQFFLVNLWGSHVFYDNHDDFDKQQIPGDDDITKYDRTIHHTDRLMRNFYKMIEKDSSAVFIYISDHGEILKHCAHGLLGEGSAQFEVPFFTINYSQTDLNSVVDKYLIPGKNRINTLCITHILSELLGYSISEEQVDYVRQQSNYVYHVDGKYYEYDQIELENK